MPSYYYVPTAHEAACVKHESANGGVIGGDTTQASDII